MASDDRKLSCVRHVSNLSHALQESPVEFIVITLVVVNHREKIHIVLIMWVL